ncbi:hypothetical protein DL770_004896 [Monosporascus sp. CRB-9-2]|nr:hypothetical protein DL770_004896 [Monosporascus sp. CRB-9-2]
MPLPAWRWRRRSTSFHSAPPVICTPGTGTRHLLASDPRPGLPRQDVVAYLSVFDPATSTPAALKTITPRRARTACAPRREAPDREAVPAPGTAEAANPEEEKTAALRPNPHLAFTNWDRPQPRVMRAVPPFRSRRQPPPRAASTNALLRLRLPVKLLDEYMAAEEQKWVKILQILLPRFPGKDTALFVFQRGEKAPKAQEAVDMRGLNEATGGG